MADGGITEAALLSAAAEAGTAAAGSAAADAAVTAGTMAAADAAATAGTAAAADAATVAGTGALAGSTAAETSPIFLGVTEAAPAVAGGDISLATPSVVGTSSGALGGGSGLGSSSTGLISESLTGAPLVENPTGTIASSLTGKTGISQGLLGNLGDWWAGASTGDKLKAAGALLGGAQTAAKATQAPAVSPGPKTTIRQGTPGSPRGGEQALAALVKSMLDRRDAYPLTGQPYAYRPRSLLG